MIQKLADEHLHQDHSVTANAVLVDALGEQDRERFFKWSPLGSPQLAATIYFSHNEHTNECFKEVITNKGTNLAN